MGRKAAIAACSNRRSQTVSVLPTLPPPLLLPDFCQPDFQFCASPSRPLSDCTGILRAFAISHLPDRPVLTSISHLSPYSGKRQLFSFAMSVVQPFFLNSAR